MPTIPYDIYESDMEIVVIMPLGGVKKDSLDIKLDKNKLSIFGTRQRPELKDNLVPQKEDCFWGDFQAEIQLPLTVYFDKIQVKLSGENILQIIVPKYKLPDDMKLEVEFIS